MTHKKDALWVKRGNAYYIKGRDWTSMPIPAATSWMLKKIWGSRDVVQQHGDMGRFISGQKYTIKRMYNALRRDMVKIPSCRLICNNKASPKSLFILWMAILN